MSWTVGIDRTLYDFFAGWNKAIDNRMGEGYPHFLNGLMRTEIHNCSEKMQNKTINKDLTSKIIWDLIFRPDLSY